MDALTVEQAAHAARVATKTIYRAIWADKLKAEKFGFVWMIRLQDLEEWQERRKEKRK